jgi:hypothetical protein
MVAAAPDYMRSIAVAEQSQQERVATLLLDADRSKQRARYQKLPGNSSPEGMFSTFNSQMAEVRSDTIVCNILRKSNWRAIWGQNDALRAELATAQAQNDALRSELATGRTGNETLRADLATAQVQNDALRADWRSGARRMTGSALNWRDAKPK